MEMLRSPLRWAILLTVLVNAGSLFTPIINEGDSVLYAALSQHIALTNNWFALVLDGKDWLDKPHFPFWITAIFFKLGGVSTFNYILPGFLFHLLGGYYTYRIARLFYGRDTALVALLLYVSTYHLMYTSSAIKAEAFLTGSIMAACYYWLRYEAQSRLKYLLLGAMFSAIAVMTKGVFTLITIGSGLVCLWLYRRQWSRFWSPKWWLAIACALLFTAPEILALYLQFDAHPEKMVFGATHISGIKFFLWDSQFGRFFNSGPIKNEAGNPWYFVHVFVWAFLPWVAVFVAALYSGIRNFQRRAMQEREQFVVLCGSFFVTFALFSATSFQLDYYTVILFPFANILCAAYLVEWMQKHKLDKSLMVAQVAVTLLVITLVLSLSMYVGLNAITGLLLLILGGLVFGAYILRSQTRFYAVLIYPAVAVNMLYVFLELMTYSAYTRFSIPYNVNQQLRELPALPVFVYQMDPVVAWELGIYRPAPSEGVSEPSQLPSEGGDYFLVVSDAKLRQLPEVLENARVVGQGEWIDHKTGTLPRQLNLAKGTEPLEKISVVHVASHTRVRP